MKSFLQQGFLLFSGLLLSASLLGAPKDVKGDIKNTLGFVPNFMQAMPDTVLEGTWTEMKGLQLNPKTALPGKIKELIGLAVASQIPCTYCVYAHNELAKLNGANAEELAESVGLAAASRHWSTYFNGSQLDEKRFQKEVNRVVKGMTAGHEKMQPMEVVDADSALMDIKQTFGFVPQFLNEFPREALAGAWIHMKNVEMSETGIPGKYKSLISLSVSSQIPCRYCIYADTAFAKAQGANPSEIREAVAMASLTRLMSTYLNGTQASMGAWQQDVQMIVKNAKSHETAAR